MFLQEKNKGTCSSHASLMELKKNCDETRFSFHLVQSHAYVISLNLMILLLIYNNICAMVIWLYLLM